LSRAAQTRYDVGMTKRFSLPTALAVVVLGAGCSGSSPKPVDGGNTENVAYADGGCGCSDACTQSEGFCVQQPADDGGGYCECEIV